MSVRSDYLEAKRLTEDTYHMCPTCNYPSVNTTFCTNPGCSANPNVSDTVKARWRERDRKNAADQAERDYINRVRSSSYAR